MTKQEIEMTRIQHKLPGLSRSPILANFQGIDHGLLVMSSWYPFL